MISILNEITAKRYLMSMNIIVLAIHACLFILFAALRVTVMACVNVVSIVCYCICFLLVNKECVREYVIVTNLEILIHAFLAIWCVGWSSSFQTYFVLCVGVIWFAQYFSVHLGVKPVKSTGWSIICGVVYIFSLVVDRVHTPLYVLNERILFVLTILNSVLLFASIIAFLGLLTNVASDFERELTRQASHDSLTGLMNRHYLTRYMNDILQTKSLENQWLAILDIDDFKMVNDRYGHLCGDFVLCSVAEILQECCRDSIVCRWGGEEFMIVGIRSVQKSDVIVLLENVRSTIADREFVYDENTKLHLAVTIGTAHYQSGQTLDEWVNMADVRLYRGKQTGKNRVISEDA